ncbi:hypothetical protein KAJ41_00225 [Candidatus Parcubacteria bacterium]|nr:hypothetical protein [Candidatus Parcubacteria bacterium]
MTHGAWDKIRGGWTDRLKVFCMEKELENKKFDYSVYNLGISGDTSENILRRLENEISCRVWENEMVKIIFAIGVNDSWFIKNKNTFKVMPDNFENNITKIIKISQKFSSNIVFVGPAPVDEIKTISWDIDISYKNEHIKSYNKIIKLVCRENKISFLDIFEKFLKLEYKKLLENGLHPNSKGHEIMFEIVRDFLFQNEIVE